MGFIYGRSMRDRGDQKLGQINVPPSGKSRDYFEGILKVLRTFASAKKGRSIDKTKRGKGTKIIALVDGNGLPLAIDIESSTTLFHARISLKKGKPACSGLAS